MHTPHSHLVVDIALCLIFATVCAHVARLLKQPLILGYIVGGVLLGEQLGFGLVTNHANIELIAEIGLIFLLFIIGLEIRVPELLRMGRPLFGLGILQFAGCALFLFVLAGPLLGFHNDTNFDLTYVAVTTALSSTLIVVKLLQDKLETNTPSGRLTLGVLILQDFWAIGFMACQPNFQEPEIGSILGSLVSGVLLVAAAFAISRYVLAWLFLRIAKSTELVLLSAVAWCFLTCGVAEKAGLSREMGALIAGLSIAAFPYRSDITARLSGVRDFFVTLFFVSLGLQMPAPASSLLLVASGIVLLVLLSRLVIVLPVACLLGQGPRLGAVTALNLTPISEFSLVIIALGASYGHISASLPAQMLTATLMTSVVATYLILFNARIASLLLRLLRASHVALPEAVGETEQPRDIVVLGCHHWGLDLLDKIAEQQPALKQRVLVADFNAALRPSLEARGFAYVYADFSHADSLEALALDEASLIVCTLSDTYLKGTGTEALLRQIKNFAPEVSAIMIAEDHDHARLLAKMGAHEVLQHCDLVGGWLFERLCTWAGSDDPVTTGHNRHSTIRPVEGPSEEVSQH